MSVPVVDFWLGDLCVHAMCACYFFNEKLRNITAETGGLIRSLERHKNTISKLKRNYKEQKHLRFRHLPVTFEDLIMDLFCHQHHRLVLISVQPVGKGSMEWKVKISSRSTACSLKYR